MKKLHHINAEVVLAELSDAGKMAIEVAERQSMVKSQFIAKNGKIKLTIWEAGDAPSDDVLDVSVISTISWRERSLRYGMDGLSKFDISHIGDYGAPIPTEEYLKEMEAVWDIPNCLREDRIFFISCESALAYHRGEITGAEAINQFGEEIKRLCEEGQWTFA